MVAYGLTLSALADPTRRRLFERLRLRERAVGELALELGISQPAVSQHLARLRRARLVRVRTQGRSRLYRAHPAGLRALREYLERMWDDALAAYAESFQDAHPR